MKMKTKKAFTFLELLVIIAILSIAAGSTGLILTGRSRGQQDVRLAARQLEAAVREAQNNALNGVGGETICGYGISVTRSDGTITKYRQDKLAGVCTPSAAKGPTTAGIGMANIGTETIKNVSEAHTNPAGIDSYVFFEIPFGKLVKNASGTASNFKFRAKRDSSLYYDVCVYANQLTEAVGTAGSICP